MTSLQLLQAIRCGHWTRPTLGLGAVLKSRRLQCKSGEVNKKVRTSEDEAMPEKASKLPEHPPTLSSGSLCVLQHNTKINITNFNGRSHEYNIH
ncbi:hypothetical protein CEP54_007388 [Fusarium duplospermum]|uniref:Uncharacterized protein n=1 Tax=Fusarium duplospermum TaxID=1325734 RepID=A0A428Q1S3_9HYPO|nr:hypothetical protein CEP54_007388 [Fusarium duplospermum]